MHPPWFRVIGWCLRFVTRWCLPQKAHKKVLDTHTVLSGLRINQVGPKSLGGSNTNFSSPPEVRGGEHKVGQQSDISASVHCTPCTLYTVHNAQCALYTYRQGIIVSEITAPSCWCFSTSIVGPSARLREITSSTKPSKLRLIHPALGLNAVYYINFVLLSYIIIVIFKAFVFHYLH